MAFIAKAAIDLVGRDVHEARHAGCSAGLQHVVRTFDVGANECRRVFDAAVHMAFGGEVNDRIAAAHHVQHAAIADIHLHKLAAAFT